MKKGGPCTSAGAAFTYAFRSAVFMACASPYIHTLRGRLMAIIAEKGPKVKRITNMCSYCEKFSFAGASPSAFVLYNSPRKAYNKMI